MNKHQSSTNKATIDGEEGGKTPTAHHCGLETQRTKVPEESCSLLPCFHPFHKFCHTFSLYKVMRLYIAILATFERVEIDSKLPFYGFVSPELKKNLVILKERVKIYRLATTRLF